MSFGDSFCFNAKYRTAGGGWVHPNVANSMALSRFGYRNHLVGTGRAISVLFGASISSIRGLFFSYSRFAFL